jgi:hypothetical protein
MPFCRCSPGDFPFLASYLQKRREDAHAPEKLRENRLIAAWKSDRISRPRFHLIARQFAASLPPDTRHRFQIR